MENVREARGCSGADEGTAAGDALVRGNGSGRQQQVLVGPGKDFASTLSEVGGHSQGFEQRSDGIWLTF